MQGSDTGWFKVLSGHLHGGAQENHKNATYGSSRPTVEPAYPESFDLDS